MCDERTRTPGRSASVREYPGLERLICALFADPTFAAELLADSAAALEHSSHAIELSPDEYAIVISIDGVTDIYDFAARLHAEIQEHQSRND